MISNDYIAGFFDGEGCITSQLTYKTGKYEKHPRVLVQITISNTHKEILDEIKKIHGGTVHLHCNDGKNKPCYHWRITGKNNMKLFLESILLYSVIKKPQIELALNFIDTIREENLGCVAMDNDIHWKRKDIHDKLRLLKHVS